MTNVDPEFTLLGDALWLDFVNTKFAQPEGRDLMQDVAAYHRWTKAGKLLSDAEDTPFADILTFRSRLLTLAEALDAGRQPPSSAIHAINEVLTRWEGHQQLTRVGGAWRLKFTTTQPQTALDAIAHSAAETLSNTFVVVRRCAGEQCSLFFADRSQSKNRRWCSLATCGQRLRIDRRKAPRITPLG